MVVAFWLVFAAIVVLWLLGETRRVVLRWRRGRR